MPTSIFSDEWRGCLVSHYTHVLRSDDHRTERSLRGVMLDVGSPKTPSPASTSPPPPTWMMSLSISPPTRASFKPFPRKSLPRRTKCHSYRPSRRLRTPLKMSKTLRNSLPSKNPKCLMNRKLATICLTMSRRTKTRQPRPPTPMLRSYPCSSVVPNEFISFAVLLYIKMK